MFYLQNRPTPIYTEASYDRHDDTGAAAPLYVADSQQGNEAGDEGAEVAVGARVSLSAERQIGAGEAGHRDAALPHGDIRQRVLLAWARGDGVTR